ncbi:unnamed protein product [Microthlaspi erraticum]|uniref:Uncharacterized protein n=1 Tax=Microthlaspi erraticum TaxID=1685480 RepID=A0A6D2KG11_9BRAS|nr:unnamed protein product [Microthlaspi erraticum]
MPLEVCNLDKPFRRYHVCTEDWSTAGRTHSAGQEGYWLRSAFSRTDPAARPHRPTREAMDHDRPRSSHHGRPDRATREAKDRARPDLREQEAHLCSFDFLSPINLNRLVKT